jgi:hypothetical protein
MPSKKWILALGPTFLVPTSTIDDFGDQQWGIGPSFIAGIKTKKITAGVFPQYFFHVGDRGSRDYDNNPSVNQGSMVYFFWYGLPGGWFVGCDPNITYDNKASSGNRWNVPVGLKIAKTVLIGDLPVKLQFGVYYSVVSQDDYGQRIAFGFDIIPVIGSLIKNPLFGGN